MRYLTLLTLILFTCVSFVYGVNEIDEAQVGGTYSQADTTKTFGLLVGTPIDAINGFIYADWQRASDDGETLAENATVYLEGGVPIGSFALSGYVEGTRDEGRIEGWQRDYGYFLRLPEFTLSGFTVTGGGGNFARQEIPELGLDAATSFNWRGFLEFKHKYGFSILLETNSTIDFTDPEFTVTPFTSVEFGDHFTLDLSMEILRSGGVTYTQSNISGKKTFEF